MDERRVGSVFGKNGVDLIREQLSHDAVILSKQEAYLRDPTTDQELVRWQAIYLRLHIVFFSHCGVDSQSGSVAENIRKGIDSAIDYFFGSWRDGLEDAQGEALTAQECRSTVGWLLPYQEAILLALLIDDLEAARQISCYPGHDAVQEDFDGSAEEHEFYILLASYLKGHAFDELSQSIDFITSGRRKGPKLSLEVLTAIDKDDCQTASNALKKYLNYFVKNEQDIDSFSGGISVGGSILWSLARNRGILISALNQAERDIVVTPDSCSLT